MRDERKKRAREALAYNAVQSWTEITRLAREGTRPQAKQATLFNGEED